MKRHSFFLFCFAVLYGCTSVSSITPTPSMLLPSPQTLTQTPPAINLSQYEAALETFFSEPEVRSRLASEHGGQPHLYIEPEFNDMSGVIPRELLALLAPIVRSEGITIVESKEASTAILHMNSIQSDPNAERYYQFTGPTITIQITTQDKDVRGLTHTFGKGYMLRETNNGWKPEQYLIITT